jgi:hypothetical protein
MKRRFHRRRIYGVLLEKLELGENEVYGHRDRQYYDND